MALDYLETAKEEVCGEVAWLEGERSRRQIRFETKLNEHVLLGWLGYDSFPRTQEETRFL